MNTKTHLFFIIIIAQISWHQNVHAETIQHGALIHATTPLNIPQRTIDKGSLTVICGSMCSGKSEEIIRLVSRFSLAGFEVLAFKPAIDNRKLLDLELDPLTYIPSRNGSWIKCISIANVETMKKIIAESCASIIAIDEVMLFIEESDAFLKLIYELVESGKKIIVGGLDLDFRGQPFGPMPQLLAYADEVIKLKAICSICGDDTYCITQRLINGEPAHVNDPLIMVGDTQYQPRCRKCHIILKN